MVPFMSHIAKIARDSHAEGFVKPKNRVRVFEGTHPNDMHICTVYVVQSAILGAGALGAWSLSGLWSPTEIILDNHQCAWALYIFTLLALGIIVRTAMRIIIIAVLTQWYTP